MNFTYKPALPSPPLPSPPMTERYIFFPSPYCIHVMLFDFTRTANTRIPYSINNSNSLFEITGKKKSHSDSFAKIPRKYHTNFFTISLPPVRRRPPPAVAFLSFGFLAFRRPASVVPFWIYRDRHTPIVFLLSGTLREILIFFVTRRFLYRNMYNQFNLFFFFFSSGERVSRRIPRFCFAQITTVFFSTLFYRGLVIFPAQISISFSFKVIAQN